MYIKEVKIENIRSVGKFEMKFDQPAGWHVLIGDNGAGKSTIVRSIALALLNQDDIQATREDWEHWLNRDKQEGFIQLTIVPDKKYDGGLTRDDNGLIKNKIVFEKYYISFESDPETINLTESNDQSVGLSNLRFSGVGGVRIKEMRFGNQMVLGMAARVINLDLRKGGWFAAAYGPFRRFTGGSPEKEKVYKSHRYLGALLSVFGEDVALSEALAYIRELYIQKLETKREVDIVDYLKKFINDAELLPHNVIIDEINANFILFKDANGRLIPTLQMSDGFRSVLSLTLELIRQLMTFYSAKSVFENVISGGKTIDLPGVVLIDEVDAHLHPTWQTKIGQWFTQYFPNIQFIVTTHSPLVCRAADKGSIWQLPEPGTDETVQEITGDEKNRLVFGNVLDQYSTGAFGERTARSEEGRKLLNELAKLNTKFSFGKATEVEVSRMKELRRIFTTDNTTDEAAEF